MMMMMMFSLSLCLCMVSASTWDARHSFAAVGYSELPCEGTKQQASCCVCKTIVESIEEMLNKGQHAPIQVGHRISEEKVIIEGGRTADRIMDVLDRVCNDLPLAFPKAEERISEMQRILKRNCESFVGSYEDVLINTFYGKSAEQAIQHVCYTLTEACSTNDPMTMPKEEDIVKEEL